MLSEPNTSIHLEYNMDTVICGNLKNGDNLRKEDVRMIWGTLDPLGCIQYIQVKAKIDIGVFRIWVLGCTGQGKISME